MRRTSGLHARRELSFREKTLRYKHSHRAPRLKTSIILLVVAVCLTVGCSVWDNVTCSNLANATTTANTSSEVQDTDDTLVKLSFVGDINLARGADSIADSYGASVLFSQTKSLWSDSDAVYGNLECVLLEDGVSYTARRDRSSIVLAANRAYTQDLADAGLTILQLSNNHSLDYGVKGLRSTIEGLSSVGIEYLGAGESAEEAATPYLQTINGVTVAFFAVSDVNPRGVSATESRAGTATFANSDIFQKIYAIRSEVDVVIVGAHWGNEYVAAPNETQEDYAHALIDAGADIVIGGHAHTIEPIEYYQDGVVFYGMGSFVHDSSWTRTRDGIEVDFLIDQDGSSRIVVNPLRLTNSIPSLVSEGFYALRDQVTLTKLLDPSQYSLDGVSIVIPYKSFSISQGDEAADETAEQASDTEAESGVADSSSTDDATEDASPLESSTADTTNTSDDITDRL